jgi:type I restriction enzyme S subunit
MSQWPIVPLGDVLKHRKEFIQINDLETYRRCRVQLHAQGIVLRDRVPGSEIKTKKQQVCRPGEFLVAEIDAKLGGYGIVPPDLEGAIVSSHYFLFGIDETKLDRKFLGYFIRTPAFQEQVAAQGSTNYAAIRPGHVLEYRIPLPPLPEQRRLVERIDALAEKLDDAKRLRREGGQRREALLASVRAKVFEAAMAKGQTTLDKLASLERGKFAHRPRNEPRFFGGDHPWIQIGEIETSGKYIERWHQTLNEQGLAISRKFPAGTLLISIAATIGAAGILTFDCCVPDSVVAISPGAESDVNFLYHFLGYVRTHLEKVAPQSAQKNINLQILSTIKAPKLDLDDQHLIAEYLDRFTFHLGTLQVSQQQAELELNAVLPAILDRAFRGDL